jgi:hypothetical protein
MTWPSPLPQSVWVILMDTFVSIIQWKSVKLDCMAMNVNLQLRKFLMSLFRLNRLCQGKWMHFL